MREFRFLVVLLSIASLMAQETSKPVTSKTQYEEKFLQKMSTKCQANDNSSCIMVKLLDYMNKMLKKPSFTIGKRITLMQTSLSKNQSDVMFNQFIQARNANNDDTALTMLVADKVWAFVRSRALRWKMSDFTDVIVSAGDKGKINLGVSVDAKRAFIEGRGKMKNSGPLIAAIILKGALIGILAFKALFLLSGKALLVSKLSLLLASLIGVKKLLGGKQKHVTYEIVNDHHRYDSFKPQPAAPGVTQTAGWQRALDLTLDSFIENFASKFAHSS